MRNILCAAVFELAEESRSEWRRRRAVPNWTRPLQTDETLPEGISVLKFEVMGVSASRKTVVRIDHGAQLA